MNDIDEDRLYVAVIKNMKRWDNGKGQSGFSFDVRAAVADYNKMVGLRTVADIDARYERLRQAVRWYADPANWRRGVVGRLTRNANKNTWEPDDGAEARWALESVAAINRDDTEPKPPLFTGVARYEGPQVRNVLRALDDEVVKRTLKDVDLLTSLAGRVEKLEAWSRMLDEHLARGLRPVAELKSEDE
jgi:hypothetical protein